MVKILFMIDDDIDDRQIFQEAIVVCNPDINMVFASDGEEALEILQDATVLPDVIFLDYNMPRMNGVQCLKRLKSTPAFKSIPTVMYTTSGDREEEKVVRVLGAAYYMRKTTSFVGLCNELKRVLDIIDQGAKQTSRQDQ